jgi:hypothetical protein
MEKLPLYLLFAVIILGMFLWQRYQRKERNQALTRFASQHGMSYSAVGYVDLVAYGFRLFGKGDDRGCENVLSGRWQNLPVKEADYWYSTKSTDSKGHTTENYHSFSIVIADLAASVPYVSIHKESIFTSLADHLGVHDIDFESEDFNREFEVTASDREFAFKLIDPRMMQWLLSPIGDFAFEIQGCSLLVACERLEPDNLATLFGAAKGFTDHIPRLVLAEYGTTQQTPPAAERLDEPPARTAGEKSPS